MREDRQLVWGRVRDVYLEDQVGWWIPHIEVNVLLAPHMLDILEVEAPVGLEAARDVLTLERRGTGALHVNVQLHRQLLDQKRHDATTDSRPLDGLTISSTPVVEEAWHRALLALGYEPLVGLPAHVAQQHPLFRRAFYRLHANLQGLLCLPRKFTR